MKMYVVALVVLVGVLGGFYGGYRVGQNNVSASASTTGSRTSNGGTAFTGGGRGLGTVCPSPGATPTTGTVSLARGTVANLSGTSMTVANTSCEVKVTFGPTVTVQKQALGSTSDLQDNQTVTVTGTRQTDGSILASSIQIGPAGGGIRTGAGGGSGSGTGSSGGG
jgi:hypothetical protein